jgi:hypothetical protein
MPFLRISSQESQIGIGIMIHDAITFGLSTRRPLKEMRVSAVSFGSTLASIQIAGWMENGRSRYSYHQAKSYHTWIENSIALTRMNMIVLVSFVPAL